MLAAARRIPADSPICNGQRSLTGAMISGIEWSVMAPVRAACSQDLPNRTHGETGCVLLCRSFNRLFVCLSVRLGEAGAGVGLSADVPRCRTARESWRSAAVSVGSWHHRPRPSARRGRPPGRRGQSSRGSVPAECDVTTAPDVVQGRGRMPHGPRRHARERRDRDGDHSAACGMRHKACPVPQRSSDLTHPGPRHAVHRSTLDVRDRHDGA